LPTFSFKKELAIRVFDRLCDLKGDSSERSQFEAYDAAHGMLDIVRAALAASPTPETKQGEREAK
jgi:hypothetical protein